MDYLTRAIKWYEKALEEKDDFIKFLLLYISLEVISKEKFQNIWNIGDEPRIAKKFYSNIDLAELGKLKASLDKNPLQNMNPRQGYNWSGKLENINDFQGIIQFVKISRNNLFHGDKGLNEERDLMIVKEGNKILQPLVKSVLDIVSL